MKIVKKILLLLLVIFIVAQFFGPEKNEGNTEAITAFFEDTNPPDDVKFILKENCFDCHSNVTRYPWYSNITPVNYWMADHVKHGKGHFDVSKWNDYSAKKKDHKLDELIEMVEDKVMPLDSYTWMHSEAKLADEQIKSVLDWAQFTRLKYGLISKPE